MVTVLAAAKTNADSGRPPRLKFPILHAFLFFYVLLCMQCQNIIKYKLSFAFVMLYTVLCFDSLVPVRRGNIDL